MRGQPSWSLHSYNDEIACTDACLSRRRPDYRPPGRGHPFTSVLDSRIGFVQAFCIRT